MGVVIREKNMNDGSVSLYLDIYHQGKRKYEFLNIHLSNNRKSAKEDKAKRKLAEKIKIKRENDLLVQNSVSFKKKTGQDNVLIALDDLINDKTNKQIRWKSIKSHIVNYTGQESKISFGSIDEKWIIGFQSYLITKISNNTALNYLSLLNSLLKNACRDKIIKNNPYGFVPKKARLKKNRDKQRVFLLLNEIEKLAKTECPKMPEEFRQIFIFCCFSGLRWSDAHCLRWDNIISINNNGKEEKAIRFRQEKTENVQYLPLSKQALEILNQKRNNNSEHVFSEINSKSEKNGENVVLKTVNRHLSIWAKRAGINKHVTFHASRHTFATLALTYGAGLYTISKLLGHQNIMTTTIYTKVIDDMKSNAMATLPKLKIENN